MKIYVITRGSDSDYHICAVASDKEKADLLAQRFSDNHEFAEVEEYDTDDASEILKYRYIYLCYYFKDKREISVKRTTYSSIKKKDFTPNNTQYGYYVYINADNEEMAIKKASDILEQYRKSKTDL